MSKIVTVIQNELIKNFKPLLQFSINKRKKYYLKQKFRNKNTAIESELKFAINQNKQLEKLI